MTTEELINLYYEFYDNAPFVRICDSGELPETKHVVTSNHCDIGLKVDSRTGRVVIVSAIDNLIKGASGQAIQNFNLILGFSEATALKFAGIKNIVIAQNKIDLIKRYKGGDILCPKNYWKKLNIRTFQVELLILLVF
jgi:hypothetical protein